MYTQLTPYLCTHIPMYTHTYVHTIDPIPMYTHTYVHTIDPIPMYTHTYVHTIDPIPMYTYCSDTEDSGEDKDYINVTLKDFERVDTLGMGGFGRVELVSGHILWVWVESRCCHGDYCCHGD